MLLMMKEGDGKEGMEGLGWSVGWLFRLIGEGESEGGGRAAFRGEGGGLSQVLRPGRKGRGTLRSRPCDNAHWTGQDVLTNPHGTDQMAYGTPAQWAEMGRTAVPIVRGWYHLLHFRGLRSLIIRGLK